MITVVDILLSLSRSSTLIAGREAATQTLGLSRAGVFTDDSGKVVVDEREGTSVPHIHAVGDVAHVCTCGDGIYMYSWLGQELTRIDQQ